MLMVTNFGIPFCLNNKYVGTMCEGTMYLLSNYVTDPIYIYVLMSACACMRQQGNMSSNQGLPRVCTLGQQGKVFIVKDDTPWQLIHACNVGRARAGVPVPKETLDKVTRLRREAKAEREAKANANADKAKGELE